jgi:4-amino-4-deoxy-L-arabinose transferase-like glycosyltransferase
MQAAVHPHLSSAGRLFPVRFPAPFIDGDEGFYLLASRLVMQHKAPYLDFFYTQAPLLPYAYAAWFRFTGISWFAARVFAALQTAVLGGLIYEHVCRETGKWIAGLAAVVLFASSSFIFAWFPIVKTFPLAALFLFLAYVIFVRRSQSSSGWWIAAAGVLFGLSVDTRSYVVAVAPVFLWWIFRQNRMRWLVRLLWFAGGFAIGIIPSLILFFASPDAFLFNNLGYHAMRSKAGLIGLWQDKVMVLLATFGGRFTGFQFSVLTLTCVGFIVLPAHEERCVAAGVCDRFRLGIGQHPSHACIHAVLFHARAVPDCGRCLLGQRLSCQLAIPA